MPYRWFIFFLIAGTFLSVALAAWKAFIGRKQGFSWFAVPLPLLLGIAIDGWSFIYWSIRFQMLDGRF